jgi:hypothetical protein
MTGSKSGIGSSNCKFFPWTNQFIFMSLLKHALFVNVNIALMLRLLEPSRMVMLTFLLIKNEVVFKTTIHLHSCVLIIEGTVKQIHFIRYGNICHCCFQEESYLLPPQRSSLLYIRF